MIRGRSRRAIAARRRGDATRLPRPPRGALRWVVTFFVLASGFYALASTPFYRARVFPAFLRANARAAAGVLGALGYDVQATRNALVAPGLQLEIREGCDAAEPAMLVAAAVLASPVAWSARAAGVGLALSVLPLLNLLRIVSLFLTGRHFPRAFHTLHVEVWQPAFLVFAVLLWMVWATWASRSRPDRVAA